MVEVLSYSSSCKVVLIEELNLMIEREEKDLIQSGSKFPQKELTEIIKDAKQLKNVYIRYRYNN